MWAASASARASNAAQLSTRSPWMLAGRSGCAAAIASQTSANVQAVIAVLPKVFCFPELGSPPPAEVNGGERPAGTPAPVLGLVRKSRFAASQRHVGP